MSECVRVCVFATESDWTCLEVWGIIIKHYKSPCLQLLIFKDSKAQFHQDATSLLFLALMCANMFFLVLFFLLIMVFPKMRKSLKLIIPIVSSFFFITSSPSSHLLVDT